ncbi:MAG TPA: NADPH-dependent FMN reductase [Micromonosporaceae bacterium]
MNVLVLSGSPRPKSRTLLVSNLLAQLLNRAGANPTVWDLAERPVPIADPEYHSDPTENPDPVVWDLVRQANAADAFILASPVYHNSFSGVLKNALDNLSISQFHHKPVGLVAFGGSLTSVQVCDQLRTVVRGLLAIAVPAQIVAVGADFTVPEEGQLRISNPDLVGRAQRMIDELERFSAARARSEQASRA